MDVKGETFELLKFTVGAGLVILAVKYIVGVIV